MSAYPLKGTRGYAKVMVGTGGLTQNANGAVTAHAGGGQANATQLAYGLNQVDTVTTAADSVKLPASVVGAAVVVVNNAANSMQVFGAGTDTINGVATGTGVAQAAGKTAAYVCITAGAWFRLLSA